MFMNFLMFISFPNMWAILEKLPCAAELSVYFWHLFRIFYSYLLGPFDI